MSHEKHCSGTWQLATIFIFQTDQIIAGVQNCLCNSSSSSSIMRVSCFYSDHLSECNCSSNCCWSIPYLIVIMIMMMMIMMKMKIIRRTLIMVQFTKVSTIVNYHRSCVLYFCLLSECNCSNWSISLCFDVADYDDNHHVTMIVSSSSISKVLGVFFFGYWGRGPSTKVVQCPGCNLRLHDDLFISIYMSIQSSTI